MNKCELNIYTYKLQLQVQLRATEKVVCLSTEFEPAVCITITVVAVHGISHIFKYGGIVLHMYIDQLISLSGQLATKYY